MARPKKATVDYFPHDTIHGSTMQILESRWGNDGYAFWFKLLELLGSHDNHFIDCRKPAEWEFLAAKTKQDSETAETILNMLAKLDAIDSELWTKYRVIFCPNFIKRVEDAYRNRKDSFPTIEKVYSVINPANREFLTSETPEKVVSDVRSTERERERERETKEESSSSPLAILPVTETAPAEPAEQTAKMMTVNDFRFIHQNAFGTNMPGGCNNMAADLCRIHTAETIRQAFETAAIQGKPSVAYVKGVLEGNGTPKKVTRLQTFADAARQRDEEEMRAFVSEMKAGGPIC